MKYLSFLFIIACLLCSCKDESNNAYLVLEAYLFANRQIDSIKISETIPDAGPFELKPITGAAAEIISNSNKYKLVSVENRPGIYKCSDSNLIIQPGNKYEFNAFIGNRQIKAWTTIPAKSSAPKLSRDTVFKYKNITYYNILTSYTTLSWKPTTEFSYLFKKLYNNKNYSADTANSFPYIPFYFLGPIRDSLISINSDEFNSPGSYFIVINQINSDLNKIFTDSQKQTFLNASQENISGAYGIFTGIYSDTVKLEVISEN